MTPRVAQGLELQTEVLVRRTDACIADQVSHLLPSSCSQVLSSCRARQVLLRGCLMRGQTASRKCPSAPRRTGAGEGVIKGSDTVGELLGGILQRHSPTFVHRHVPGSLYFQRPCPKRNLLHFWIRQQYRIVC